MIRALIAAAVWSVAGLAGAVLPLHIVPSNINVTMLASQTSGYAPLAVVFSTVGTTSATGVTTRPFDGMQYTWDFGDSGAGSWSYGVRAGATGSKNSHSGPIAAHVYETPGTYTVTLTTYDGTNTATTTQTITVSDPDGAGSPFLTTGTICFSTGADFTGCPSGATQTTTASWETACGSIAANKRLLFRRGDTWTGAGCTLASSGRWIVGAFGSGAKPKLTVTSGAFGILLGAASQTYSNGSVQDLEVDGNGSTSTIGVQAAGTFNNLLLLRVDSGNGKQGFSFDNSLSTLQSIWRNVVIAESTVPSITVTSGGAGVWGVFRQSAVIGSLINSAGGGEFNMRSMYSDQWLIADNKFQTPSATKSNLSIRAPDWVFCNQTTVYTVPNNTYTQYVDVAYNVFVGDSTGGGDMVNSSPASAPGGCPDGRVRYLLFERNLLYGVTYTGSATYSGVALADTSYSTARSNLIDLSGYAGSAPGINGLAMGSSGSLYNLAYNNSVYGGAAVATTVSAVQFGSSADHGTCINNLGYFAAGVTNAYGCRNQGTNPTESNNSTLNAEAKTDPQLSNYSNTVPLTSADWKPAGGSYATGTGASVPVWSDFFGTAWSPTWSIGAVHP